MFENTIFLGAKAFEKIKSKLNICSSSKEMSYGDITFYKSELLEPNAAVTSDPTLVKILKELDNGANESK